MRRIRRIPKEFDSKVSEKDREIAFRFSHAAANSLITTFYRESDEEFGLQIVIVVENKTFKRLKKRSLSKGLETRLYFDTLKHKHKKIAVIIIFVEIEKIENVFCGHINLASMHGARMLGDLEKTITSGKIRLLFVSKNGKHIAFSDIGEPYEREIADNMRTAFLSALSMYQKQPWSIPAFTIAVSELEYTLKEEGIQTIDKFIEVRKQLEALPENKI